ncbi:MAG: hypothetical protein HQL52_12655 [Magnetococcales bacterium]|nr:hypothetical protein [Magnetococcales bacterium]
MIRYVSGIGLLVVAVGLLGSLYLATPHLTGPGVVYPPPLEGLEVPRIPKIFPRHLSDIARLQPQLAAFGSPESGLNGWAGDQIGWQALALFPDQGLEADSGEMPEIPSPDSKAFQPSSGMEH